VKPGHYDTLTGFKATHADMTCQGVKFQLGVWYHLPESKPLKLCDTGFHFCIHPSGPRTFYPDITDRIFRCEAEDVLVGDAPGAAVKCVARHIRLVSEIKPSGSGNTGNDNTGDHNTGSGNKGDYNTGNHNAGNYNTGSRNAGNYNTGSGNATDNCTGFFCTKEPGVLCFDTPTNLTRTKFLAQYGALVLNLAQQLSHPEKFDYTAYKALPGWSLRKIKALHMKVQQP
jgi:hypothetical protein